MKNVILLFYFAFNIFHAFANWQSSGPNNSNIKCLVKNGSDLFALGENDGVFISTDNGISWNAKNNGLNAVYPIYNTLAIDSALMLVGADNGIYISTNYANSWTLLNNGLPFNTRVFSFLIDSNIIYAGTSNGLFTSTNSGNNWTPLTNGLPNNIAIFSFLENSSGIFAGTSDGIYLSTNNGNNWNISSSGITSNTAIFSFVESGTNLFAGTNSGVYLSVDSGSNWNIENNGLTNTNVLSLETNGQNIFAGTFNGLFVSNNNGANWAATNIVPANSIFFTNKTTEAILLNGSDLFTGGNNGINFSPDTGSTWSNRNKGLPYCNVVSLSTNGSTIYATSGSGALYSTNDNAVTWERKGCNGISLKSRDSSVFIGGTDIYYSNDSGTTWARSTGFFDNVNDVVGVAGNTVFAKYNNTDGFISTNNGISFVSTNLPYSIFANSTDSSLYAIGNMVLFYDGMNWIPASSMLIDSAYSLAVNSSTIFAGIDGGIITSPINGSNWTTINFGSVNSRVTGLAVSGSNVFATTSDNHVFASTNNGLNWNDVTDNFNDTIITTDSFQVLKTQLVINNTTIFVGGKTSVWTQPLTEITGINELSDNFNFSITPNPSRGKFIVTGVNMKSIIIENLIGDVIYKDKFNNITSTELDLSVFAKGMYFASVSFSGKIVTKKIIIQ